MSVAGWAGGVPASVVSGHACALCWRPFGNGTRYRQTLDEVSRDLCAGCLSRLYPAAPKGAEEAQIVSLNLEDVLKTDDWIARVCRQCGEPVEGPPDADPQCIKCWLAEHEEARRG